MASQGPLLLRGHIGGWRLLSLCNILRNLLQRCPQPSAGPACLLSSPLEWGTDGHLIRSALEDTCIKWCLRTQLINASRAWLGKMGFETYTFATRLLCLWSSISSTYFSAIGERSIYNSFISCIVRYSEKRHPKCTALLLIACFCIGS